MEDNKSSQVFWKFAKTRVRYEEYFAFVAVLLKMNTTCSRFLRKVIREVIGQGPDLLPNEIQDFREAVNQVATLGRNINQLVRAYYTGQPPGLVVDQAALEQFKNQVEELRKELATVIQRSKERWVGK